MTMICEKYTALSYGFIVNSVEIKYEIHEESINNKLANIRFSYNNYDYFLDVKGLEGITDITEDTLKILLNDLFM